MGGSYYDRDVEETSSSSTYGDYDYSAYSDAAAEAMDQKAFDASLDPEGRSVDCEHADPIVVAMDVTRSRGDDSKIVYDKMPMLFGQIMMQQYLTDPAISFAAIGDATSGDEAPLQICDYAAGDALDSWLTKIWLEEGGGGTGQESYELAAYFYARHCELKGSKKGFLFFTGDEGFYPKVSGQQIEALFGDECGDVDTAAVFEELRRKFHVFFLYPRKSAELRRADIDAEIQKRLQREGAKSGDICVSLIWNNRNDLDLHVVAPSGEEIYFGHKSSACGGELDVDMNVSHDSMEPVENIYWPSGGAPVGHYRVFVQNYSYAPRQKGETAFKIALTVNGEVTHYTGIVSGTGTPSDAEVCEFDYGGAQDAAADAGPSYEGYDEETILGQWRAVLGDERVLILEDPKAVVDVMLGAIALTSRSRNLSRYLADMDERGQTTARCEQTSAALQPLSKALAIIPAKSTALPVPTGTKRKGGSRRF